MPRGRPKDGSKNPGGRPKCDIDYVEVEKLAKIMCTQEEIAAHLDIHVATLLRDEKFCEVYKKGIENGKSSLRRKQYLMSESNPTMAIWLGKQYLNQKDKTESVNVNVEMTKEEAEKILKEVGIEV